MGFAVFLEPEGEFAKDIQKWKKRINIVLPGQPYCSHPPHCTLIHCDVKNEQQAILKLKTILIKSDSFSLEVDKVGIFWKDIATGGGHTLHLKIKPKSEIYDLQLKIAKILRPLVTSNQIPDYIYDNSVLKESFVSYGFPFVGSHWIPHFTIASLITNRTHPIITDFMQWKPLYIMNWFNISFWHIDDEHHTRLDKQLLK